MKKLPFVLALTLLSSLTEAEVNGQFKANDKSIVPNYLCAFPVSPQAALNTEARNIEIVLSEYPCDAKAASEALNPHVQLINQNELKSANYVLLWVEGSGKVGMNATFSKTMLQYLDSTKSGLKAELSLNKANRITGHIYTPQPVKTLDGEIYQVDFTIDAKVTLPAPGKKLPNQGGESGKALMMLFSAIEEKDIDKIRPLLSKEALTRLEADYRTPEENRASILDTLGFWLPKKDPKIIGGKLLGKTAILEIEGKVSEASPAFYRVQMIKDAKGWVLADAQMIDLL